MAETRLARPWWRYLRLSVRGLIVLVLVIGGGLGWIVHSAKVQRDAVAAIRTTGATVLYDWESTDGQPLLWSQPWAPQWLVDSLGVDYFGHVTYVSGAPYGALLGATFSAVTDAEMVFIGHLSRVETLLLRSAPMTDAGLAQLKGLTQLRELDLGGTRVTDAGLAHLKRLTQLRELDLGGIRVTDAGLAHLKGLTQLRELNLAVTQVDDAGLLHLKGLTQLQELNLAMTEVGDAGLAHLKGLTHLQVLTLILTPISSAGVQELQQALPKVQIIR
jgi:hypothetical protein